ncbi:MAG: hypothetical protein AAF725_04020, partial [Acidobacteriota bacterium]
MRDRPIWDRTGLLLGCLLAAALGPGALAEVPEQAAFETAEVPEAPGGGDFETTLTVPAFGRYAVRATSPRGMALQVVDRMAGPG